MSAAAMSAAARDARPFLVCVEGNIGAGKSTLLAALQRESAGFARVVPEPMERWSSPWSPGTSNMSPLAEFYDAPVRNALGFQVFVVASYARAMRSAIAAAATARPAPRVLFLERDPFNVGVFTRLGLQRGDLSEFDGFCVTECAESLRDACIGDGARPDGVIYLRADDDTCMRRIATRGRACERGITADRVSAIGRLYDEAYLRDDGGAVRDDGRTLVLDGARPTAELAAECLSFARLIEGMI